MLAGDMPAGWGWREFAEPIKRASTPLVETDVNGRNERPVAHQEWAIAHYNLLCGVVQAAAPDDDGAREAFCQWMRSWLLEYSSGMVSMRSLLEIAALASHELKVGHGYRYAFIGIVAEAAALIEPKGAGSGGRYQPRFMQEATVGLVRTNLFNESGEQVMTQKQAVELAHARISMLLPPRMKPSTRSIENWMGYRMNRGGPPVRRGRPPK